MNPAEHEGPASRNPQLKEVGRQLRSSATTIILVTASVLSAVAAAVGLKAWVSIAAAVAAVLTGLRVLYSEFVVPVRLRTTAKATVRIYVIDPTGRIRLATAVHLHRGQWVTAAHSVRDAVKVSVRLGETRIPATVLYADQESDLAVLKTERAWSWRGRSARSAPEAGDSVKVVGWTSRAEGADFVDLQVTLDYTVQGESGGPLLVLTGPAPQRGFPGAPAVDVRTGRVVGITIRYAPAPQDGQGSSYQGLPRPSTTHVALLSGLPKEFR